jgi:hypothetical protein
MEKIDAKLLQGPALCLTTGKTVKSITITGGTTEIVEKNGRKVRKSTPWERQATPDDVLSWADRGDAIVIVTTNGYKFVVDKKPKAASKGADDAKK